jgi:hypothetical protein
MSSRGKKNKKSVQKDLHASQGFPFLTAFSLTPYDPDKRVNFFRQPMRYLHEHIMFFNNSKFFAGIVMILLNIGSKYISIQFSQTTEEYLKFSLSKQLLVFSMSWMGTRDIYTALGLTAIFTILSDHLFNEDSRLCLVPHKYRVLNKAIDTNDDGQVSETELAEAIAILEKAKREKQKKENQHHFAQFDYQKIPTS